MTFNKEAFMHGTDQPMPSEYPLTPEADYPGTCVAQDEPRVVGDQGRVVWETHWQLDGIPGRKRFSVWLDVDAAGNLLPAPNNAPLGIARAAVGQNTPGVLWQPSMFINARALCRVRHSKDGKYDNIASIAPLTQGQGAYAPPVAPQPMAPATPAEPAYAAAPVAQQQATAAPQPAAFAPPAGLPPAPPPMAPPAASQAAPQAYPPQTQPWGAQPAAAPPMPAPGQQVAPAPTAQPAAAPATGQITGPVAAPQTPNPTTGNTQGGPVTI